MLARDIKTLFAYEASFFLMYKFLHLEKKYSFNKIAFF